MALTREELKIWANTNPTEKEWAFIRMMSHIDEDKKIEEEKKYDYWDIIDN